MTTMDIMFDDLNPSAQKRVLEFEGIKNLKDLNLEVVPLFILEKD